MTQQEREGLMHHLAILGEVRKKMVLREEPGEVEQIDIGIKYIHAQFDAAREKPLHTTCHCDIND